MHKILIVAATAAEIDTLITHLGAATFLEPGYQTISYQGSECTLVVTGVGLVNTAYYLGKLSQQHYNALINVGVCGAFNRSLNLGDVVEVIEDCIYEMGAENVEQFIPYSELNLGGKNVYQNKTQKSLNPALKQVKGISVNKVHGNEKSIALVFDVYPAQVESMEGASFFMACEQQPNPYYQIRAVSNYVEPRNKENWRIKLAINNLNSYLIQMIDLLITETKK